MEPGKTLYVTTRREWRSWLARNHAREKEIWLVYYRKNSGKRRLAYNAAVEEALCYGWIDSIQRRIDAERLAQRFSPRRPGSAWSAMNIERLRRLRKQGKVTKAGLAAATGVNLGRGAGRPTIAPDLMRRLRRDAAAWKNFQAFPSSYKRIRIGWIEGARSRPEVFEQRLKYFLKMTAENKRFGMVR